MIGASGRYLTVRWAAFNGVLNQHLPLITWLLESVQVKCDQVIEEETFDLAAKDIDLGAENVQGVTIATSGSGAWLLINEGSKLYRHMYGVMRAGT